MLRNSVNINNINNLLRVLGGYFFTLPLNMIRDNHEKKRAVSAIREA